MILILKPILLGLLSLPICCNSNADDADPEHDQRTSERHKYDVVIYGGTSAAITAAVQAKRMQKSVVVVSPDKHLGGLSASGLGWTDTGNKAVIGGLSREFYHRIWKKYQEDSVWKWQKRDEYGGKGQGNAAIDGDQRTMWIFEPHIAETVFEDWIREEDIRVFRNEWLNRLNGVEFNGNRIDSIRTLNGKTFAGKMFIDATYEGDLMAAAGVDYHVGREAMDVYDEKYNGVQTGTLQHGHHFGAVKKKISPYVVPGDSSSGLLPRISDQHPGEFGAGDDKVQAYCFRMCLTNHPENRVAFTKPKNYKSARYELLARIFAAGYRGVFNKFDPIPNRKTDTNNHGPFSTDNIGFNYDYPEASYERRREIIQEHEEYQKGLLYFIATDPRVPEEIQRRMKSWGLAKDEFVDNGHWPHQIYVREARRMIGNYVMTEHEVLKRRQTPDPVAMGSYTMDSHNVQRYITPGGFVENEGDIQVRTRGPYQIAYGSLIPKRDQCENLLVPVCVSSSHIAFGSIRMEPVFMILGHSAGAAACLAIDANLSVQNLPYEILRDRLLADEQVLEWEGKTSVRENGVDWKKLPGIVVDDDEADLTGVWTTSVSSHAWIGSSYRHDGNLKDGSCIASFRTKIPATGDYEVRLAYTPNENRSNHVEAIVKHDRGENLIVVDEKKTPSINDHFVSLGKFRYKKNSEAEVVVTNENANGYVVIDAVQWLPVDR